MNFDSPYILYMLYTTKEFLPRIDTRRSLRGVPSIWRLIEQEAGKRSQWLRIDTRRAIAPIF